MSIIILGIESSCDDTAAAVLKDGKILANLVANQTVHQKYGGVIPELAARAHQQNIVPVVSQALKEARTSMEDLDAIAFTRGPGLIGPLLVGSSFTKAFALGLDIPIIEVNHMRAHIMALFIEGQGSIPQFPFLCLTVSGGHTQIVKVTDYLQFEILGETRDDAAGEAFDKAGKILGLDYPGGPLIEKYAEGGDKKKFTLPEPKIPGLDFSFSGLKTAFLYLVREETEKNENFITEHRADLCASMQHRIITILINKLILASKQTGIKEVAIAGGVSANGALRNLLYQTGEENNWNIYIPDMQYCTDNAAMIAIAGYYKYQKKDFAGQDISPVARYQV